jgi:uncharacterized membrane protein
MTLTMPLVAHLVMSLMMFSLPHLTRREILFGLVLPADFRTRPAGRRAIRTFRFAVAISALAGLMVIVLMGDRVAPVAMLGSMTTVLVGFITFIIQNRKLRRFAVQHDPVRELELTVEPERLPRFAWLGLGPFPFLAGAALYVHAHWDSIPTRHPIHWGLDGQPDAWAELSFRGVYGPLVLGAEMSLWFFGLALATWYGSRRTEPLRRPALAVFVALSWAFALMMPSMAIQPLIGVPVVPVAVGVSMAVIVFSVFYLIKKNRESRGPVDSTPNECWKGGIVYYNPSDPAIFVGRRDGVGFTLNMGNPWSWAVMGSPLVLFASSAFVIG